MSGFTSDARGYGHGVIIRRRPPIGNSPPSTRRASAAPDCPDRLVPVSASRDGVNGMPNGDPSAARPARHQPADLHARLSAANADACLMGTCTTFLPFTPATCRRGPGCSRSFAAPPAGSPSSTTITARRATPLATQSAWSFTVSMLDGGDPSTDRGQFCSAQYSDDGTLHVAYVDAIADRLLYVESSTSASPSPTPEIVDDGMRDDGPHSVGAGAALHIKARTASRWCIKISCCRICCWLRAPTAGPTTRSTAARPATAGGRTSSTTRRRPGSRSSSTIVRPATSIGSFVPRAADHALTIRRPRACDHRHF